MLSGSRCCSVSSQMRGSPNVRGVAPASTYNQRGVITAVPKAVSLGLTRCTLMRRFLASNYVHRDCLALTSDFGSYRQTGRNRIIQDAEWKQFQQVGLLTQP